MRAAVVALLPALLLLAACAADEPDEELLEHRFTSRPVRILASTELPDQCLRALEQAVLWYRARDATLTLELVPPTHPAVLGVRPVAGAVGVLPGELGVGVQGETRLALTLLGNVFAAEVTLGSCAERVSAHELGHALGLVHVGRDGNLMHLALDQGGWDLTEAQLAWIADETLGMTLEPASADSAWGEPVECAQ